VIRTLRPDELDWANARYASVGFAASTPAHQLLVAELDGARVGLGRLVPIGDRAVELGGIWTDQAARGRGVARAIVTALLARAGDADVWCIPFEHLARFYMGLGLAPAPAPWPAGVADKVADCAARGLAAVVVLARLH
jgi:GNAT superfamily N-acetyltransferase